MHYAPLEGVHSAEDINDKLDNDVLTWEYP